MEIKEDSISLSLTFIGIMILLVLLTFEGLSNLVLVPLVLLLSGITLQLYTRKKIEHDESTEEKDLKAVFLYTLLSLVGMGIASFVSLSIFLPPLGIEIPLETQIMYGTLYAIAEERFFRGALLNLALWKTGNATLSNLGTGGVFSMYHLAIYGTNTNSLMYVLYAGIILGFSVTQSGRLSPAMLGHIGNNVWAYMGMQVAQIAMGVRL